MSAVVSGEITLTNVRDGEKGAVIVYRGEHSPIAIYYNNVVRRDVVRYNSQYYIYNGDDARSGVWNSFVWASFGAQFDSVATNLLLAESANVADWIIKDGKISSQQSASNGKSKAVFDGANGGLEFNSDVYKYTSLGGSQSVVQTMSINSTTGYIEVRNNDYETSYISSQGIFSNRAGIQAMPISTGIEMKGAVVALGYGDLKKSAYGSSGAICGLFGDSINRNSDPAPSWGAYVRKLFAQGLYVGVRRVSVSTYLTAYDCYVGCYNSNTCHIYLPSKPQDGQVLYVARMNSAGVTIQGNGKLINVDGTNVSTRAMAGDKGDMLMLIYDGQYWKYGRITG